MDTVHRGSIQAQLVSTSCCKAHWIITFSQFGECINAELSGNTVWYTRETFGEVLDSIEFRINDGVPPIDEMKGHMWLPEQLMKHQEFCRSAEWVWGVLWLYTHIGYIEEVSTAGISLDQLLELLVDKQLEALIFVGMGRLQVENDDMRGCSRTESDDGQEARSLETIGDVHCHPEHYEGKRERLEGATGLGKVCLEGKIRGSI